MAVRALGKPAGVPCRHLVPMTISGKSLLNEHHVEPNGACGIYERRPDVCAGFVCVWLRDTIGLLTEDERPDRIGVVLTASSAGADGRQLMEIRELFRGASRTVRVRRLIERISKHVRVRVIAASEPHPMIVTRANEFLKSRREFVRRARRRRGPISLAR